MALVNTVEKRIKMQKDGVINNWSWRDGANKHYVEYLNRLSKAAERGVEIPNR